LAVTDWRLRRWRLWFLALMTATHHFYKADGKNTLGVNFYFWTKYFCFFSYFNKENSHQEYIFTITFTKVVRSVGLSMLRKNLDLFFRFFITQSGNSSVKVEEA